MPNENLILRSVYLEPPNDAMLRQLAHELHVTKSDLIRAAVAIKLREWMGSKDPQFVREQIEIGIRSPGNGGRSNPE